ncbi:MAG TPA: nickel pincer cofactor biosynthesis protein LarC [Nitrospiraceae bacterium]|nr:nickel pincer cofactor biosynthesis protein LarC [Nitrospiraceae bacterium]
MRLLHFDCFSGISGDMILGALVDAGLPLKELAHQLKPLRAGGYALRARKVTRGGLHATKVDVVVRNGFRSPLSLASIQRAIRTSRLPGPVKERSREVFDRLAGAEGIAHRVSAAKVQFHEVGVVDSLVDVVGGVLGCHLLGVDRITASPVNLGAGFIESAHGRLPAPGPAVAALARGLPIYSAGPVRELTTPTGLALLSVLAEDFGPLPLMRPTAVGYGAGTADPEGWPNVLRVFLGESVAGTREDTDTVVQVETNLDDLNPQAYDTVMARLFQAGALDVTLTPVIMKQGRPGIVLTALAPPDKAEALAGVMLRETTTLGVRMQEVRRLVLPRHVQTVRTSGGTVRMKVAETGRGGRKAAPEYRDCRHIAELTGRPVREIMEEAILSFNRRALEKRKRSP